MKKVISTIMGISFLLYIVVLMRILFLRRVYVFYDVTFLEYIRYSTNIVPFNTIIRYINALFGGSMNISTPIKNLFGNLFLFLPMGFYLPFFMKKLNKIGIYSLYIIVMLVFVEIIQLLTRRGFFDIDDLILNMSGALIGYLIWKNRIIQSLLN